MYFHLSITDCQTIQQVIENRRYEENENDKQHITCRILLEMNVRRIEFSGQHYDCLLKEFFRKIKLQLRLKMRTLMIATPGCTKLLNSATSSGGSVR